MNFGKLQLKDELKKNLAAAVDAGTLSHAVLLTGGTVKERRDLAILLAQATLCEQNPRPCLTCTVCKKIKNGTHPDIFILSGETGKPKSIKISAIRDIRERAGILPNEASFQIFIILEASGMGEEAQNALLKILEEPPKTARFILASRSRDDFRPTILSRVTVFAIREDSGQAAGEKENPKAVKAANEILEALLTKNEYKILLSTGALEKDRKSYKAALETIILTLRNALVSRYTTENSAEDVSSRLAAALSDTQLLAMQDALKALLADADKNANENLLLTRLSLSLSACIQP